MVTSGHVISMSDDDMHDSESRKSSLIGQINGILCDFRNVTCNTKIRLIKTYCTSLYGAQLWDLSNNYIDSICIAWRRGVRKMCRFPNNSMCIDMRQSTHRLCAPARGRQRRRNESAVKQYDN